MRLTITTENKNDDADNDLNNAVMITMVTVHMLMLKKEKFLWDISQLLKLNATELFLTWVLTGRKRLHAIIFAHRDFGP